MKTMDEIYKYPQFKGFYLIMDNSPIHGKNGELSQLIRNRGYKCVYLPPYSLGLNSIGQSWAIVKGKVRCSQFGDTEDLKTKISEAYDQVPRKHFYNFAQHSVNVFEDCLTECPA
jgi:transposase